MVPENKQINFIGLQNNRQPSQHTVGNVYKASGNFQQRPLYESIAEQLSHVLGSSVLFVFWYHSPNFLDTPRTSHFKAKFRPHIK
jgi:hypothetical protein